ncbi:MAG: hypothetical protein AB8I08_23165 [Sandaracinaceae bacterium]
MASRAFVKLDLRLRSALIDASDAVLAHGDLGPQVDTAIGRDLTTLTLRRANPRDRAEPTVRLRINHAAYERPARDPWGALLGALFDRLAPRLHEEDRALLSWLGADPSVAPYR